MSQRSLFVLLSILFVSFFNPLSSQVYPPQLQLVFDQMPNVSKPGYLNPITDPTFNSQVVRITDQAVFNTHSNGMATYHHYAKSQPWNSDGTKIALTGWPTAILDGQTHQVISISWTMGGHRTWSNTQPNIIYGTNHPLYDGNCIASHDVTTNSNTLLYCFNEYEFVSFGEFEGNLSNDDRYMAIQCRKPGGAMEIACFDMVNNSKVSTLPAPVWPNNVTMSQSGNYVIVQWDVYGTGPAQGVWAYNRSDMSPVRNLSPLGGSHFDYGYDTQGNEVMVGPHIGDRRIRMIRIDNGQETSLLGDNQMSWYIHVSCRNLNRPGWAYLTEFADPNTQTFKPNYQKIFAVQLNPNANNNALTETFAHVHHSPHVNYERSPFGVPNRDGSKVMFRSDWMGNSSSEINSYVAYMPGPTCNLSCTATQTSAPTCGNNDGSATATAQGGTAPYTYQWSSSQNGPLGQTTATVNGLPAGTYTVTITDANNCSTACTVTLVNSNNGNVGAFANVPTQNNVAWNAGNSNANRPKPPLGVWQSGDIPGTEIMRVSDASGNGLHFYGSRQVWNIDMTKMMIGNGVIADNKLLDVTNNYALLPLRVPLNTNRVWSNTDPDLIYGMQGQSNLVKFNASTGVTTVLYTRPGGSSIGIRSKGNLPYDDSKIAIYESSTNKIISFDLQTNTIIAEIVWPHGNINSGGNYVTYDWTGNWIIVGLGTGGPRELYRMTPNLTNITLISSNIEHWDNAYNTDGESVQIQTRGNGSLRIVNIDDPNKNYNSPIFGGSDPSVNSWTPDYISGRGQTGAPGWVAFGGEAGSGSPNHPLGLYKIDGNTNSATIKVIGFDHHSTAPAASAGGNDDRQKPSISPDGNQVIFTSDWGIPNGALSSYIIRGIGGGSPCNVTCVASQTTAPTCGNNNGQATVTAAGGTPPYTYAWNNGQTTQTIGGLGVGTYSVVVTDANNTTSNCTVTLSGVNGPTCTASQTTAPTCGNNDGSATATAQGGTAPYTYQWSSSQNGPLGQTTATVNGLPAGTYTVTITDANNCSTACTVTLVNSNNGNVGAFANVPTQNNVAWNAGNANINRPKPALGVWEPGDITGTEIMRVSDDAINGLHFYNSRQVWNADMTKMMIGDGVVADNKLLDVTNNYALLPTRIPLNSHRVWSNTNPDLIYGMQGQSNFSVFNVTTGVNTVLYTRPGGSTINIRSKGNLPGDDSKVALYEPSTNRVISYDLQTNTIIAEIVWPNGNINATGGYVSFDWKGNWIVVGMGDGANRNIYRMTPNLTNITLVHNQSGHSDFAYNTAGESVQVITRYNGSAQVVNFDDPNKNYITPIFGGADPNSPSWSATPDYFSGRGQFGIPGWIAFGGESGIGSPNHPLGFLKIDENTSTPTIKVIGYDHHSSAGAASNGGNDDRQKPSVSPDGNQVIFTSDWGVPNGPLSAYIIRGIGGGGSPCNVTCSASQTITPTCGNNNGAASVTANGGTAPYSYSWNNGQTTQTIAGIGAGTYTVVVTDANNTSSTCSVTVTGPGIPSCTAAETTAPACGVNNGVATATAQGGTSPYTYLWSDPQAQTSAVANGLSAGTYTVVVTDANNCTTQCSVTLSDPSSLSCSIVETTPPTNGNNGVATVTATGGTVSTGDPRTDLLASPDRIGYGAGATGGTNYVYVTNFNQLKNALETAGNYVLLDPSVSNQGIGFTGRINPASNTTLDGSLAPGSWLYPNFNAGFPANTAMFNYFSTTNCINYSIELRGYRAMPYDGNHPSANGGAFNVRGSTVWFDHVTITEFWGHSIMIAQGGDDISLSNMKIINTGNGLWLYFANYTPRYVSLFNSEINAQQNTPYNEGASHFHMWNNFIHDVQYGASITGVAENNAAGQNGPVRTASENNVFTNCDPEAERGLIMGENWGGPVRLPGYIYSTGTIYNTANPTRGNVSNTAAPWTIPYSYTLMPANQVEAYVAINAGKIPVTGNANYTYQWNDPAGQTSAVASGLSSGTYNVTVTDGAGCSTICSITMTGSPVTCNIGVLLEGAYNLNTTQLNNGLQTIGVLPSGQPYNVAPWNYNGTEGGGWQQSDYPNGAIDWVLLSLRTNPQPSSEVAKVAALLMEDGTILPASIELNGNSATAFYIVVEHRNHIPAMTPTAIPLINNMLNYDFRINNSYNTGAGFGQKQLGTNWVLYAGEISQSSPVGYEVSGADIILWNAANGNFGVYMSEDTNMDGDVNGMDRILLNVNNGISSAVMK